MNSRYLAIWIFLCSLGLSVPAIARSFSFAAAGDLGHSSDTAANLKALKDHKVDFFIALGDLSYGVTQYGERLEQGYCDWVRSYIGEMPFELISGNHDANDSKAFDSQGYIGEYVKCLPDRLNSTAGPLIGYGVQYYFDYENLMRVILISPDLKFNGVVHQYKLGVDKKPNKNLKWLGDAIDGARKAGIPWITVGMHKNCISISEKSCTIGADVMNYLIEKHVDLILQGHDHVYCRSKQLKKMVPDTFKDEFVSVPVDEKGQAVYLKEAGPLLIIDGTFGKSLYDINIKDSEIPYFSKWMGNNVTPSYGYVEYEVSATEISGRFRGIDESKFSDAFVIRGGTKQKPPKTSAPAN